MKANGQDAIELAELGLQVFPLHTWSVDRCSCNTDCTSPAKHPRTRNGLKDATTDLSTLLNWWGMWPAANIGVRTGPESGIVVLDIDPRNGGMETWLSMLAEHEYTHTGPACITGGGGMHLWMTHPGVKILSRSSKLGAGLDVKADGGYVCAPPSVHQTGAPYVWVEGHAPWECDTQPIPEWLLVLMQDAQTPDKHGASPVPDKIRKGARDQSLASLAGTMRYRNMGETAIFNALMAENAEKCDPPLDTRDVARIAKSIAGKPGGPGEAFIVPSTRGKSGSERREEAYVPVPRTFADLKHKLLPPIRWAVQGFLPQGCAIIAGAAKLGKSWFVLGLQFAVGTGIQAFDYLPTTEGDCLYLALEDGEIRLQDRAKLMIVAELEWPSRCWYETKWPRVDEGGAEALEAWLGQHPEARIVVIDTFALFKSLDVGKSSKDIYASDYAAIRAIKSIADEYGVCILLVTHLNKGEHQDWVNGMTGSTGLSGSADTLINMARPEGQRDVGMSNEATIRLTGRDVAEQAWAATRDGRGWWKIGGDAYSAVEARSSNATVGYMQMLWGDGYTEVTATLLRTVSNSTKATANRNLSRAADGGHITRLSQGVYTLLESDRGRPIGRGMDKEEARTRMSESMSESVRPDTKKGVIEDDLKLTHIGSPSAVASPSTTPVRLSETPENSHSDGSDGSDAIFSEPDQLALATLPAVPCHGCGQVAWERRLGGVMCGVCRPVVKEYV